MSLANRHKVQNHIKDVHAAAMALLAESATEHAGRQTAADQDAYLRRASGGLRAEASLTPAQIQAIHNQDKGQVLVAVRVTDESGNQPIQCEMPWAWVNKQR